MENKIISKFNYSIYLEDAIEALNDFILNGNYSKVVILGDSNSIENCLPYLNLYANDTGKCDVIEIDAGEENKNIDICIGIWSMMNDFEMDRSSLLINLGGGMISDIGAFAAATYLRGIDFINIPTTLLAMVDASVGGKNGIDMNSLKNRIGTITFPKAVFIITPLLESLAKKEFHFGFAEMLKHGLIADENHFYDCIKYLNKPEKNSLVELISKSISIKNTIVEKDYNEKNIRKLLNYGHSLGHAIESYFLEIEKPILHGEAVLMGILIENKIAIKINLLSQKNAEEIEIIINQHFSLPVINLESKERIINFLKSDKKNTAGIIHLSLISKIGTAKYNVACEMELIEKTLEEFISTTND